MPKLNDTQTILLNAAANRDSLSLYPLPDTHANGGARVTKAIAALINTGLVQERSTALAEAVSRTEGDDRYGLFVTLTGLAAIGVVPEGGEVAPSQEIEPALPVAGEPNPPASAPAPRVTKSGTVLDLLRREQGATLAELIAATDWLPHTTRAALTGLRKKGHAIEKAKRDGATCYRIVGAA